MSIQMNMNEYTYSFIFICITCCLYHMTACVTDITSIEDEYHYSEHVAFFVLAS